MKILGIVSEYNPFHNGHLYHLNESIKKTKADYTVCIMSGNFLQRGEPALYNKWIRANMAVKSGIDIVFELPTVFACNSAEYFAQGSINLLDGLGCVTHLSFGSEDGTIDNLKEISNILAYESDSFKEKLHHYLDSGISFPAAREKALMDYGISADILEQSNNVLGIEYLKSIKRLNSKIEPVTIKRYGAGYNDTSINGDICSATAIRSTLFKTNDIEQIKSVVPEDTFSAIANSIKDGISPTYLNNLFDLISYKLLSTSTEDLKDIFSFSEGIENRMMKIVRSCETTDDLISAIKSKRYTQTRVQRMLMHALLGFTKNKVSSLINDDSKMYLRVLGVSKKGSSLIRHIKNEELNKYPIITNINHEVDKDSSIRDLLNIDIMASDIYNLVGHNDLYGSSDYVMHPHKTK